MPGAELEGRFDLSSDGETTFIGVDGRMFVGVEDLELLSLVATGFLQIDNDGIVGKVVGEFDEGVGEQIGLEIPELEFSAETSFDLLVNTTSKQKRAILPGELHAFGLEEGDYSEPTVLADGLTTLQAVPTDDPNEDDGIEYHLYVPKSLDKPPAAVPDPDPDAPGVSFVAVHAEGALNLPGIELAGSFDFISNDDDMLMAVQATAYVGMADIELITGAAGGVIRMNGDGMAGKVHIDTSTSTPFSELAIELPDFGFDGKFDLLLNTMKKEVEIVLPDGFDPISAFREDDSLDYSGGQVLTDQMTTLFSGPATAPDDDDGVEWRLFIPKKATRDPIVAPDPNPEDGGEFFINVHGEGELIYGAYQLRGGFDIIASESETVITAGATFAVGMEDLTLMELDAAGALEFTSDGISGKLELSLGEGSLSPLSILGDGYAFDGTFEMFLNTTGIVQEIELPEQFDATEVYRLTDDLIAELDAVGADVSNAVVPLQDGRNWLAAEYDVLEDQVVYTLLMSGTSDQNANPPTAGDAGSEYIIVHAEGLMAFPGFQLDGGFDLFAAESVVTMSVDANLRLGTEDFTVLEASAGGALKIDEDGAAGKLELAVNDGDAFSEAFGGPDAELYGFDAQLEMFFNTTGKVQSIDLPAGFDGQSVFGTTDEQNTTLEAVTVTDPTASVPLDDRRTWLASEYDTEHDEIKYQLLIPETAALNSVPADPTSDAEGEFYVIVHAEGVLTMPGMYLDGGFDLYGNESGVVMTADAELVVGTDDFTALRMTAGGVLQIDEDGLAGKLDLDAVGEVPLSDIPGVDLTAEFDMLLNTTGKVQAIELPQGFDVLNVFRASDEDRATLENVAASDPTAIIPLDDNRTWLASDFNTDAELVEYTLLLPEVIDKQPTPPDPSLGEVGDHYIVIHAEGEMTMPGFTLEGGFDLHANSEATIITVDATMFMGTDEFTVLELAAGGAIRADGDGVAGKLALNLEQGGPVPLDDLGLGDEFSFSRDAEFEAFFNTTGKVQTIDLPESFDVLSIFTVNDADRDLLSGVDAANPSEELPLADNRNWLRSHYNGDFDFVEYDLIVPETLDIQPVAPDTRDAADGDFFVIVRAEGSFAMPAVELQGGFDLFADESSVVMTVDATAFLGSDDFRVLEAGAGGALFINNDGIAGKLAMNAESDAFEFIDDLGAGFSFDASLSMLLNTTEQEIEITLPEAFDAEEVFDTSLGVNSSNPSTSSITDDQLSRLRGDHVPLPNDAENVEYTLIIPKSSNAPVEQTGDPNPDQVGVAYAFVNADGTMNVPGFELSGNFAFWVNGEDVTITADAQLSDTVPGVELITVDSVGVMHINEDGIAGKISVVGGASPLDGIFDIEGEAHLLLNTMGEDISITLPTTFDPVDAFGLSDDEATMVNSAFGGSVVQVQLDDDLTALQSRMNNGHRQFNLIVPGSASRDNPGPYVFLRTNGSADLVGGSLDGRFDLLATGNKLEIDVEAETSIPVFGSFDVDGRMTVVNEGVYGNLSVSLRNSIGLSGFSINGYFQMLINTTDSSRPVERFNVIGDTGRVTGLVTRNIGRDTFMIEAGGNISLPASFSVYGAFEFISDPSGLSVSMDGSINAFSQKIDLDGAGKIYNDGNLAAKIGVSGLDLGAEGFRFTANSANFELNTSSSNRLGVSPRTARVYISNAELDVLGLTASGSASIGIRDNQYEIMVPRSDPFELDFFIGNVDVSGHIRASVFDPTDVDFEVTGSVEAGISVASSGIEGEFEVTLSNRGVSAKFDGSAELLGVDVGSVSGAIEVSDQHFSLSVTAEVCVGVGKAKVCADETVDFDIGTADDPPATPPAPPTIARVEAGTLILGQSVNAAGFSAQSVENDNFVVTHVSGTAGNENVWVIGKGYSRGFDGVNIIESDTGAGDDSFIVGSGVRSDVLFDGGSGNDFFSNEGSGDVEVYGGSGHDILIGGSGNDELFGGDGDDEIQGYAGSDTIEGNDGDDMISGGDGDDTISGDAGADTIEGNTGNDAITGGTEDDAIVGGLGDDNLAGNEGNDVVVGDLGDVAIFPGGFLRMASLVFANGGNDIITGDAGADLLVGGAGDDELHSGDDDSNDVLIGDSATVFMGAGEFAPLDILSSVVSTDGGDDTLTAVSGNNVLIGGAASDSLTTGAGDDILFGDYGDVQANAFIPNLLSSVHFGAGGNDTLIANEGNDFAIGGAADDVILGGANGDDIILGDDGQIIGDSGEETSYDIYSTGFTEGGGDDKVLDLDGTNIIIGGDGDDNLAGGGQRDWIAGDYVDVYRNSDSIVEEFISVNPSQGGNDGISAKGGFDVVIAGMGDDVATGNSGKDILLGDSGRVVADGFFIPFIETISPADGGVDQLLGDHGDDFILGGIAGDSIEGGGVGDDVILGDHGRITISKFLPISMHTDDELLGGDDQILTQGENNVVIGGVGSDSINSTAGDGSDVVLGDLGVARFEIVGGVRVLRELQSTNPTAGGDDMIFTGSDDDIVIAGLGDDEIDTGSHHDIAMGDHGRIVAVEGGVSENGIDLLGVWQRIESLDMTAGGDDSIFAQGGHDIAMGGFGDDLILGGVGGTDSAIGHDIILGDHGLLLGEDGSEQANDIITTDFNLGGGNDRIADEDGHNIMIGGDGNDNLRGGTGWDWIAGDYANVIRGADFVRQEFVSTHEAQGGIDGLSGNRGNDYLLGGADMDIASGHGNDDVVVGDNGRILTRGFELLSVETTALEIGGADTLFGDGANDIVIGGDAGDVMNGGVGGNDVLLGDNGKVVRHDGSNTSNDILSSGYIFGGGDDQVTDPDGLNVIIGGRGSDVVKAGSGRDYVAGDYADVVRDRGDVIIEFTSERPAPNVGAADRIFTGDGDRNVVIGGPSQDHVTGGAGIDFVFGDNGRMLFDSTAGQSVARSMATTNADIGAADLLVTGGATDYLIGGALNDVIGAGSDASRDVALGDHGRLLFTADEELIRIDSTDNAIGGDDQFYMQEGADIVVGGPHNDFVSAGANDVRDTQPDVVLGDNGIVLLDPDGDVRHIETTTYEIGGDDEIFTGGEKDVVVAGAGDDFVNSEATTTLSTATMRTSTGIPWVSL